MPLAPASLSLGAVNPAANGSAAPGTSPLASHQDHVHPSGGGASLTDATATLAADVNVSATIGTFTTILSLASLAAGTWLIWGYVLLEVPSTGLANIITLIIAEAGGTVRGAMQQSLAPAALTANDLQGATVFARVTPGATTSYNLRFTSDTGASLTVAKANGVSQAQGANLYTWFEALKIA